MTKMPRVLKYASAALAILLLFFAALVLFALTPWGMTAAVSLAEKMVPQLTVASTEGTLLDASLEGVSYRTPSATFTSRRIAPGHRQIREMQQPPITATVDPKKFPTPYTTVITSPRTIETNCQNGTGKTIFGHDSNSMGMMMLHPHQR